MQSLLVYNHRVADSNSAGGPENAGGPVEDVLKRLSNVETNVFELKSRVDVIQAIIPHLATKADVIDVRTAVAELRGEMSAGMGSIRAEMLAGMGSIRAEMLAGFGSLRAELASRDTAMIKWMIGTVLASLGVAFTIAKFVH